MHFLQQHDKWDNETVIFNITMILGKGYNWEDLKNEGTFDGLSEEDNETLYELFNEAVQNRIAFKEKYSEYKIHYNF